MKYTLIISLLIFSIWQSVYADQCADVNNNQTNSSLSTTVTNQCTYIPKSPEEYQQYCNERFGFCLDYPHSLKKIFTENGDSVTFNVDGKSISNHAFEIAAYGFPHGNSEVVPHSLKDIMNEAKQGIKDLTFQKKGENWFILSGYINNGNTIFYLKEYVGTQNTNTLFFQYPKKDKKRYDKVVNHIVSSFKPGNLEPEEGHIAITEYIKYD